MKKVITKTTKNPTKTIQISGSTTSYDIQTKACLTNYEIASTGTAATEKITKFSRKSNRYDLLRNQHRNYKEQFLGGLLSQMFNRRKRYSFQMVKLLYMFPDDTFSENISVNSYDRLFFQDQHVHTMVKLYETLEMQAKIWAFLNLKSLHTRRKLQKFTNKIQKVQKRLILEKQKVSFDLIHQFSIKIRPQAKQQIKTVIKQQITKPPIQPQPQTQTIIKKQVTQVTESKTIIQRKQPIKTRIQYKSPPKSAYEPIKTQRIQQNTHTNTNTNHSNIRTQNTNQIIRISALESSPLVRRIQLSPDNGMRVIMPPHPQARTYTTTTTTSQNYQSRNIQTKLPTPTPIPVTIAQPTKVNQQSRLTYVKQKDVKVIYPHPNPSSSTLNINTDTNRTVIGTQRRIQYHRPSQKQRTSIYQAQTIRRIQAPVITRIQPIQSVPVITNTKPVQIKQVRQVNKNVHGYYSNLSARPDTLVHTVHGDCTINIHNGCSHSEQKQRERESYRQRQREKTERIERNRSSNHYGHTQQYSQYPHPLHPHHLHMQPSLTINVPLSLPTNCLCYQCQAAMHHIKNQIQFQNVCSPYTCPYSVQQQRPLNGACSYCHSNTGYSQNNYYNQVSPYSIEDRIEYMKHLDHINNIGNSKLEKTRYAKDL